jgi:hypothetical protein
MTAHKPRRATPRDSPDASQPPLNRAADLGNLERMTRLERATLTLAR